MLIGALVVAAACTSTTAPKARFAGTLLSVSGVVGLIGGAATQSYHDGHTAEIMAGFSIMSGVGIGLYAAGELLDPLPGPRPETVPEKHRRWAKILTERAGGAAREGNCRRVRRLERRVHVYNRDVHDFVFMRDPEIVKCLEGAPPAEPPSVPALPGTELPRTEPPNELSPDR
ncbi:MAG: hypothetical protein JNL83_20100 [Myxococcales bacterium]|nr:hypothetical protein [Myxococcales bacterium]